MAAQGVELLAGLDELAVMGFAEVVPRLEQFRDLLRRVDEALLAIDLVILIDFPGFNIRVARAASGRGRPVLYYVAPKIWASRPGRAATLARDTDHIATIFPFETEALRAAGAEVTFVGNPLLDRADDVPEDRAFRRTFALDPTRPILALLPGSRPQEIDQHLALFLDAAALVTDSRPDILPVVSRADALPQSLFEGFDVAVVDDTRALLRHARVALVKAGTSTLEAALERTPTVVAYRTSASSWAVIKRVLRVNHVSLPNLLADRAIVPELIQSEAKASEIASSLLPLFEESGTERKQQLHDLADIEALLGATGVADRVVDIGVELMDRASA
jgi:lipid-A-disaccharide synthase